MRIIFSIIVFCISVGIIHVDAADVAPSPKPKNIRIYSLDQAFFRTLASSDLMRRDMILSSRVNSILEGVVLVTKIEDRQQYRKKVCIVASIVREKISLQFNIYTDNSDYKNLLEPGNKMSFKGQCAALTPLTSRRDSYILDIILEDGAAVIE